MWKKTDILNASMLVVLLVIVFIVSDYQSENNQAEAKKLEADKATICGQIYCINSGAKSNGHYIYYTFIYNGKEYKNHTSVSSTFNKWCGDSRPFILDGNCGCRLMKIKIKIDIERSNPENNHPYIEELMSQDSLQYWKGFVNADTLK
jgi:hypothetical protein